MNIAGFHLFDNSPKNCSYLPKFWIKQILAFVSQSLETGLNQRLLSEITGWSKVQSFVAL